MKNYLRIGALTLLGTALTFGVSSCCDEDPDYGNVTPPVVADVHNISGSIAGIDGLGISGATVTMGGTAEATATTDENGYFVFENVAVGTYTLQVTAEGKISQETTVEVTETGNGQNVVWNVMLASEESVTNIEVNEDGGEGDVVTEALADNELAEIPVEVDVPATSLSKPATIWVSPIYSESEASRAGKGLFRASSATEKTLVIGAKLSCSDQTVRIDHPMDLTFNVDEVTTTEVRAQKYSNGQWVDVPVRMENGKVIVSADEFTSYGLFATINFASESRNEPVTFRQNVWDNLYGNNDIYVGTASYTYTVGMDIDTKGTTVFTALLVETLARRFGAASYTTTGNYPMNVTLPVGTKLQIAGIQQINTVTASVGRRSVSGTQYGDVTIAVATSNRQHTGGSSTNNSF